MLRAMDEQQHAAFARRALFKLAIQRGDELLLAVDVGRRERVTEIGGGIARRLGGKFDHPRNMGRRNAVRRLPHNRCSRARSPLNMVLGIGGALAGGGDQDGPVGRAGRMSAHRNHAHRRPGGNKAASIAGISRTASRTRRWRQPVRRMLLVVAMGECRLTQNQFLPAARSVPAPCPASTFDGTTSGGRYTENVIGGQRDGPAGKANAWPGRLGISGREEINSCARARQPQMKNNSERIELLQRILNDAQQTMRRRKRARTEAKRPPPWLLHSAAPWTLILDWTRFGLR